MRVEHSEFKLQVFDTRVWLPCGRFGVELRYVRSEDLSEVRLYGDTRRVRFYTYDVIIGGIGLARCGVVCTMVSHAVDPEDLGFLECPSSQIPGER